jgi:antitoxin ParD1/3/4
MGTITSITVDEELAEYVQKQLDDGRYGSASEVIEEALRLMKQSEEDSLAAIRAAIEEGEASGEPQPFDFEHFIAQKRARRLQG